MILFTCSRCGQTLPAPIGKISCSCGHTFTKEAVKNNHNTVNKTTMLCVHRKSVIARAECDCGAAPPVYGCELHTYAMKREYPHAPAGVLIRPEGKSKFIQPGYCNRCPDFNPG